ncbi:glycosyltransferase [Anabaena cylindrica FACHB-243]|uniref:Glycosyl transferase family 2 n=1 Tax=Anabaena cylindrica (strain ATCC 27899 / PCC 7122) TaxID=272123 RepID=K9ZLG7_ANACC|nr:MULTISPECIES: glycosyltransferase family 2 protein [Anabaena]AFZ59170.1 glycosyl transferase family 2 [Anabaena cylindrica PCC 7122]MBD2416520.1 glycosyltransferase [Anabaena cylindrica FACHB-243]MBY5281092.1 glycosyltransferase [Anabaena sp. CCAP 1446/1C]MBY5309879.1 glycosyltransferase [Anabaena sp. CCAP 1446/1C]MCM2407458.1 glycosyltransferase [Anabaena sp. CCAP 1446/1C]
MNDKYLKISIITPSYNQGHFIEETICSVLDQKYPNLEYIIIDGGSTDNTLDIIKKYEKHLAYWVSEPDKGQTHAINKGLEKATGDIIAYLNSDDYYLPETLFKVAEHFNQFPETDLLHGKCRYVNQQGEKIGEQFGNIQKLEEILDLWDVWWKKRQLVQPEVFWSRRITETVGLFKEELYFVMDYDYWCRIIKSGGVIKRIDSELTCFRFTAVQKSNQRQKVADELLELVRSILWDRTVPISLKHRLSLQGKWLYQVKFLCQVEQSVISCDKKLIRWLKTFKTVVQFPQILLASSFQSRFKHWFMRF